MRESELLDSLRNKWPMLRRWIEVPGTTSIFLNGDVADSIPFLYDMARLAIQRQGGDTAIQFSFTVTL